MREMRFMGACESDIGGLTQAMQAQKFLLNVGISVRVIKNDASDPRGCAYALQYPCTQEHRVREELRKAGIRLRGK